MSRPDWHSYFMNIAKVVATRATCDRKHVGAVIVRDRQILSTGYNGAPKGLPDCDSVGHLLMEINGRKSCCRVAHAEVNAIAQAARNGVSIEGATLYTTLSSCYDCAKVIINAGIACVVFGEVYASARSGDTPLTSDFLREAKIMVIDHSLWHEEAKAG